MTTPESIGAILGRLAGGNAQQSKSSREELEALIRQTRACLKCDDGGWVHPRKPDGTCDFSRMVPCQCQSERLVHERLDRLRAFCDVPSGSESLTFEAFDPGDNRSLQAALRAASTLVDKSHTLKWLTLAGAAGLGKTHLVIAVCRAWLERGKPAKYVFVPDLLDWLRAARDRPELPLAARMDILKKVPLLALDDLGVQKPTSWAMEKLNTIIDYRYANNLPLMVTTNKRLDELPGDDEGRIGSRLRRFFPGKVIVMEGSEYVSRRRR